MNRGALLVGGLLAALCVNSVRDGSRIDAVRHEVARLSRPPAATTSSSARTTTAAAPARARLVVRADTIAPDPLAATIARLKGECGHGFTVTVAVDGHVVGACAR